MTSISYLRTLHGHEDPYAAAGRRYHDEVGLSNPYSSAPPEWMAAEWWGASNDTVIKTSNLEHSQVFPLPDYDIPWLLFMGYGNDTAIGYDEDDVIYGGHGDDTLKGGDGDDGLNGEEGNDRLWGGNGDDGLGGGDGNDRLWGDAGDDILKGDDGNDQLYGGEGNDELLGGKGNDTLDGHGGTDRLEGGEGDDRYYLRQGDNDTVVEVATHWEGRWVIGGVDRVDFTGTSYTLAANVEDLYLAGGYGTGASLYGNADDNKITAQGGHDWISALDGNDTVYAGDGNDTVDGGTGNDSLYGGLGNDNLVGGTGNDYIDGETGADKMTGGLGDDTFIVDNAGDIVTEGLNEGIDTVYSWLTSYAMTANVENLFLNVAAAANGYGNTSNNTIHGNVFANTIHGGDGNDTLYGSFGNDTLRGDGGSDLVDGGVGDDTLYGDADNDVVRGGDGNDWAYGGAGNDSVMGGNGNDFVFGDAGADNLWGQAGNDALYGGADNDTLRGGDGDDSIVGGIGADMLYGEGGADTFRFLFANESTSSAYDTVKDFLSGQDKFDVSMIDANSMIAGNQAFNFMATKPFFTSAGDLWTSTVRGGVMVHGDLQGDGVSDFSFMVSGATSLNASNFIL